MQWTIMNFILRSQQSQDPAAVCHVEMERMALYGSELGS